jgi:threonine dehydratase
MTVSAAVDSVLRAIGGTPVVRQSRLVPPGSASIVVKLEYFNPTGSYKDRMALAMIEGAEASGALRPGMRVVEFTGGSTGSSLAMVCAMKGYPFHPLSSDAFSSEKLDTMRAFGADLELVPSDGGQVTPALFDRFRARIAELAHDPNTFWTDQFHNADALNGYANIGRELVEQVGQIDALVSEIAASAQEQAVGLNQVNSAVNSMDQVTQQNAAMVEQSTAATHALKSEAAELRRLVGEFRTGEAAVRAPRPSTTAARPAASRPREMTQRLQKAYGSAAPKMEVDGWEEF